MKIQFSDLGAQHRELEKQLNSALKRCIKRGDFILGEDVRLFEEEFAKFCNTRYAVGVGSGTSALFLALKALNIGSGDEVIVPAFTYIATAFAVSYTGARPVFVDIDEKTYNIDVTKIKQAITNKTKAIIPVHLYGQPASMPEVLEIARKNNLKVIEDAAQAHGSSIKMEDGSRHKTGGLSDIGCFSFYPSKNLGALGDGGMVVTNNADVYNKINMLRNYGRVSKYSHSMIGYNDRLDTLQAAILRLKLRKLDKWNKMRQDAALIYNQILGGIPGIITPYSSSSVKHVYHVYAIRIQKRDQLYDRLNKLGIGAIVHYPVPLHLQEAYKNLGHQAGEFPVSERTAREIISLPMYPHIKKAQIRFVCETIKGFVN